MAATYRLRQLWRNVTAGVLDDRARQRVSGVLGNGEQQLFDSFDDADQKHSYRVLMTLEEAGYTQPDLLKAALLHDVGKTRLPLTNWDRSVAVALEAIWPGRIDAWGDGSPDGWKRPFVVRKQHARWGAEMAEAAGSSPNTVALIRYHQDDASTIVDNELRSLLVMLQWSDDQN